MNFKNNNILLLGIVQKLCATGIFGKMTFYNLFNVLFEYTI